MNNREKLLHYHSAKNLSRQLQFRFAFLVGDSSRKSFLGYWADNAFEQVVFCVPFGNLSSLIYRRSIGLIVIEIFPKLNTYDEISLYILRSRPDSYRRMGLHCLL